MARQISQDYASLTDDLVVVGILRGSVLFMSQLIKQLDLPLVIDFLAAASYGSGVTSSGNVRITEDTFIDIHGKHVLVIEDIVDTGITLSKVLQMLQLRGPLSLKLCTLLSKPSRRQIEIPVAYCGFEVPDVFVVGYGLDYADKYRHLPYIGVLKENMYS
ncbi:MAG: hypoxanthine phosphoribosyltransferase [Firmicutes bacterium]|nr:hypoxanthine phosphoribosyltransferase [Bacillota bacterium]